MNVDSILEVEQLRKYWHQKNWLALDNAIDFSRLDSHSVELTHYKIFALLNIDSERHKAKLQQLLRQQIAAGHSVILYSSILAELLLETEQYEAALSLLLSLPKEQQQGSSYFYKLLRSAKGLGNNDLLEFAVQQYHYFAAVELIKVGEFGRANAFLQQIVKEDPDNNYYSWLLASNFKLLGQDNAAVTLAARLNSEFSEVGLRLQLQIACIANHPQKMFEFASSLLQVVPDDIQAMHALASVSSRHGEILVALQQYQAILAVYPFDVFASLKSIFLSRQLAQQPLPIIVESYTTEQRLTLAKALFNAGYKDFAISVARLTTENCTSSEDAFLLLADLVHQHEGSVAAFRLLEANINHWQGFSAVCCQLARYGIDIIDDNKEIADNCLEKVLACLLTPLQSDIERDQTTARYLMQEAKWHVSYSFNELSESERLSAARDYKTYAESFVREGLPYTRLAQLSMEMSDLASAFEYVLMARQRNQYWYYLNFIAVRYHNLMSEWGEAVQEATHGINLYASGQFVYLHIERCIAAIKLGDRALALTDLELIAEYPAQQLTYLRLKENYDSIFA
jgi:thioredoxin-like negative regulator of GroEL